MKGSIAEAEKSDAIGGYKEGLTIAELDNTFQNTAKRDALLEEGKWPLVIFSHGSGAFRGSYTHLTEYLASNGYIVVACDHPSCARFTIVNGKVMRRTAPPAGTPGVAAILFGLGLGLGFGFGFEFGLRLGLGLGLGLGLA